MSHMLFQKGRQALQLPASVFCPDTFVLLLLLLLLRTAVHVHLLLLLLLLQLRRKMHCIDFHCEVAL